MIVASRHKSLTVTMRMPAGPLLYSDLYQIVFTVREAFQQQQLPLTRLKTLYQHYSGIEDVDLFVKTALKQFPILNCGLASVYLQKCLQMGQVIQGHYHQERHTILQLPNHWIIDITADQFDGPPIYIGPVKPPWRYP